MEPTTIIFATRTCRLGVDTLLSHSPKCIALCPWGYPQKDTTFGPRAPSVGCTIYNEKKKWEVQTKSTGPLMIKGRKIKKDMSIHSADGNT